ncbi:MAG: hypothetical protein LBS51_03880 [Oscillospiraceae bacterium]|nr:hypothetical protein [Oscillospiraceae bacterium]
MANDKKIHKTPGIILTVFSGIGIFLWLGMTLFALLFGGSPGPDYDRTIPMLAVLFIALGFVGSIIGVTAGSKALRGARKASIIRAGVAAAFCASGCIPLFVLELYLMGIIYVLIGAFPTLLFLFLVKILNRKNRD